MSGVKKSDQGVYELSLPVFKQGDDLDHYLGKNPDDPAKAFLGLAEQYEDAAKICRRVAGVAMEAPKGSVTVNADSHLILVEGPPEAFAGLVTDKTLRIPGWLSEMEEAEGYNGEVGDDEVLNDTDHHMT